VVADEVAIAAETVVATADDVKPKR